MANNKSKSRKERKIIIFTVLGLAIVGGFIAYKFTGSDPRVAVSTEKVQCRNITEVVNANGKIEPVLQVKIAPEVSGEIIQLEVKEGQNVKKGDLLFKIKPDNYLAARNSAKAGYNSSIADRESAKAGLQKAKLEFHRCEALFNAKISSESDFLTAQTTYDQAKTGLDGATERVSIAQAQLDNAEADLSKTTVYAPMTGTVSKLNSQLGERVVGTATMAGTDVMTLANLNNMEARVDIGEIDVPLIKLNQKATLEVDSFKDQPFNGSVTAIANSANNNDTTTAASVSTSTDATKFQVKILLREKEHFLPGMSVTAKIETRYRTNAISVPIQSVTTRLPGNTNKLAGAGTNSFGANALASNKKATNAGATNVLPTNTFAASTNTTSTNASKKADEPPKPIEVVFVIEGDHVKKVPVKLGISDENYYEISNGLKEGQEIVSGGYRAINRDLDDSKKIVVNAAVASQDKAAKNN